MKVQQKSKTWFTSDTHFSHRNIIKMRTDVDKPLRDYVDIDEMNEDMVDKWNSLVAPHDKVIHLGDVAFAMKELNSLEILNRLNGKKTLVMGNHDYKAKQYMEYFSNVCGCMEYTLDGDKRVILTHIPVHTSQVDYRFVGNVHGHLHSDSIPDDRYICVSVEQFNMAPVSRDEIIEIYRGRNI